ncbi:hypothetical protein FOL46_000425 [Perkinsus olseni]|nr:hypothetical protein FOL46_000425 [Perkinsus olseni]
MLLQLEQEEDEEKQEVPGKKVMISGRMSQPDTIIGTMRPYQLDGLTWMCQLCVAHVNGILADEMGLGKTLQTISLLTTVTSKGWVHPPHMVVGPKTTLLNWAGEFKKFCPSMRIILLHGTHDERRETIEEYLMDVPQPESFDVLLTTFDVCRIEKAALRKIRWGYFVMDEAHRIKNDQSSLSQVVRSFTTQRRLLLTGTPLQNNLQELWALLNFLMPSVFTNAKQFDGMLERISQQHEATADHQELKGGRDVITVLHRILRPFMLRRLKSDVATDLPEKRSVYVFVQATDMQRSLYRDLLMKNTDCIVNDGPNSNSGQQQHKMRLLNTLMQLRKCCNHPYLFEGMEPGPPYFDGPHLWGNSGKLRVVDKLLERLAEPGPQGKNQVLIFTQMTRMLDIMDDYLRLKGYGYCRIDGDTAMSDRQAMIDDFTRPDSDKFVFILSTRAGGLGINLNTANYVIIYDSDFNPQMDLQAIDRAHRIGQKRQVTVYRLVTQDTVEEKIVERAAKKMQIDNLVIQKGKFNQARASNAPTKDEVSQIIRFGAQEVFKPSEGQQDVDIDAILKTAEERTADIDAQMATLSETLNINTLSLDGSVLDSHKPVKDEQEPSTDEDLPEELKLAAKGIYDIGPRVRKERFQLVEEHPVPRKKRARVPEWRTEVGGGYDHQLYNGERLDELDKIEYAWNKYKATGSAPKSEETASASPSPSEGESESEQPKDDGPPPEFTPAMKAEKKRLLSEGFPHWSKKQFNAFVRGCKTHGKDKLAKITEEIEDKSPSEVRMFHQAFFSRAEKMMGKAGTRIIQDIDKCTQQVQELQESIEALNNRIEDFGDEDGNVWADLKLPADHADNRANRRVHMDGSNQFERSVEGPSSQPPWFWSEAEDRALMCALYKCGYGKWEEIRALLRYSVVHQFNFNLQLRTTDQIKKRCDQLMAMNFKEEKAALEEALRAAASAKKKRKHHKDSAQKGSAKKPRKRENGDGSPESQPRKKAKTRGKSGATPTRPKGSQHDRASVKSADSGASGKKKKSSAKRKTPKAK